MQNPSFTLFHLCCTMMMMSSINLCAPFLPTKSNTNLHLSSSCCSSVSYDAVHFRTKKRDPRWPFLLPPSVASIPCPPLDAADLQNEFGRQGNNGVSFSNLGESCVVKMEMENESAARLMLPGGLITSYKALMWHGGTMELLHTSVAKNEDGEAIINGGLSLDFKCNVNGVAWSPNNWILRRVKGNPQESIEVELISQNAEGNLELKHIIKLKEDVLVSEIEVSNSSEFSCEFEGVILTHITASTPEATFAIGLQGSDYSSRPPVLSDYSLVHPSFGEKAEKLKGSFLEFLSNWGSSSSSNSRTGDEEAEQGEEDDNCKSLQEEMSRIYTSAPRSITILDRGRRNSVSVEREGFREVYMFSPGSSHEWYGGYAYVCIGQAALLKPVTVRPHSQWKGKQNLCNPNLD